jgi:hypothetical protein
MEGDGGQRSEEHLGRRHPPIITNQKIRWASLS